jgi:hypothetical protein
MLRSGGFIDGRVRAGGGETARPKALIGGVMASAGLRVRPLPPEKSLYKRGPFDLCGSIDRAAIPVRPFVVQNQL